MRTLFIAVPVSLLLVASDALAQSQEYPLTTTVQTVQVSPAARKIHVTEEQTDAIKGVYEMSNGWRLKVQPAFDGIVAQIDKERPMRLVPVADDKYATPDGNVAMEFNRGELGEDMLMSYVPKSRIAGMITIGATMASR